jgi:hypothetical protein
MGRTMSVTNRYFKACVKDSLDRTDRAIPIRKVGLNTVINSKYQFQNCFDTTLPTTYGTIYISLK